ncbi:MAG: NADH-quinone oxidoreductase subunit L [Coriobacteriia bacterium]|nr:NADH-quinone oxidoreductase subunit L [Coriobacteriia bacterium]
MTILLAALAVPALLACCIAAGGSRSIRVTQVLALGGPLAVLSSGLAILAGRGGAVAEWSTTWLAQGDVHVPISFSSDALSGVMLAVVGVVAACVVCFSWGYMAHEEGRPRYFSILMLFTGAMAVLVLAQDLVTLFVGWELVGACSYLLIGFWYRRPAATRAAIKAFMTTRVGDAAMLVGMALLWRAAGTLSIGEISSSVGVLPQATTTAAALLLFVGAAGKSAQFPLHIWLPDAMEGPTPVSALIHAATMVASGVFLIARTWPLFEASQAARGVMLAVGVLTAVYAAVVAVGQSDIKKMLAHSTISQLGFMFAALGAGAWGAAMFHLVTHAAFKALLFLAAGSVIHATGTQDLREMGGLFRKMPLTAACWIAGALALSGWWPFAGFFSKDAVIAAVAATSPFASWVLVATSALTAVYIWRATAHAFFGEREGEASVHGSGLSMALPLVLLATGALALGWFGRSLADVLGAHEVHAQAGTLAAAVAAVAAGTGLGAAWYLRERRSGTEIPSGAVLNAVRSGFGVDASVETVVVRPFVAAARWIAGAVDRKVIDRLANGVGGASVTVGGAFARLQTGEADVYASFVGVGFVVLAAIALWVGGR